LAYGKTKTVSIVGSALFVNGGSSHATGTLTIEIVEDVDYIQATLLDTGEFVYLEHTFITGDILKIDLSEEMVYKNDYSIMKDCDLESDFFVIPPGESEITISSGVGTLIFTERWL
jgi:phage-related protein